MDIVDMSFMLNVFLLGGLAGAALVGLIKLLRHEHGFKNNVGYCIALAFLIVVGFSSFIPIGMAQQKVHDGLAPTNVSAELVEPAELVVKVSKVGDNHPRGKLTRFPQAYELLHEECASMEEDLKLLEAELTLFASGTIIY